MAEKKIQKYLYKLSNTNIEDTSFNLYLNKVNYWYNNMTGGEIDMTDISGKIRPDFYINSGDPCEYVHKIDSLANSPNYFIALKEDNQWLFTEYNDVINNVETKIKKLKEIMGNHTQMDNLIKDTEDVILQNRYNSKKIKDLLNKHYNNSKKVSLPNYIKEETHKQVQQIITELITVLNKLNNKKLIVTLKKNKKKEMDDVKISKFYNEFAIIHKCIK